MMLVPSIVITQKRVTSKRFDIQPSHSSNSLVMTSPKWRSSIDEQLTKIRRENSNHRSRLSLRSISYGFGLETKPRQTIPDETISPSLNYQLPSNKIELDLNQQEIIRRMGSFKKSL
jgi:hypothetical protein